jgi:hypothetical protein
MLDWLTRKDNTMTVIAAMRLPNVESSSFFQNIHARANIVDALKFTNVFIVYINEIL